MTESLLSPSKITAWLDCDHFLTLTREVDAGVRLATTAPFNSLAQLLVDKGNQHESDCLVAYRGKGLSIHEVEVQLPGESFADWVHRVGSDPLDSGADVIYQMPFLHEGIRGVADFLIRTEYLDEGSCHYEPVDAKLARSQGKPGHVLQLCFYAEGLAALTGQPPKRLHLWLGSGHVDSLVADEFLPYWNRMRSQLASLLDGPDPGVTTPEPCQYCDFCEFQETCISDRQASDSLVLVAGIHKPERAKLGSAGLETVADLASATRAVPGLDPDRLSRLVGQASLQVEAREEKEGTLPYRIVPASDDPVWGRGFDHLPAPDDGDVFLDFEGDPFWRADVGLFFLFGLIVRDADDSWQFQALWAHDRAEEAKATADLIGLLAARRRAFPGMHVYHYNHTERSSLQSLSVEHGEGEETLVELIETGLFVDLYPIVRNAIQVGAESYGLKPLEQLTGYRRGHDIDQGSAAVVEYEEYMKDGDRTRLGRIADYNEDDVRSTLALRDWLVAHRPQDLAWRPATFERPEGSPELDAQVAGLHALGPDTPEHLLGDLLGYWQREWRAHSGPKLAKGLQDDGALFDDPDVLAGLECLGLHDRMGKSGKPILPVMKFRWPAQLVGPGTAGWEKVLFPTPDGAPGFAAVADIDPDLREVSLIWGDAASALGTVPTLVMENDWVSPNPKPEALSELAAKVLDPSVYGQPNPVSVALLRRGLPQFEADQGPGPDGFSDDVSSMERWAPALHGSYVAIQGPPGTGKTYRGAHLVLALILAGKRVGITAMSHHAIDNLLEEVVRVFDDEGQSNLLHCIRRGTAPEDGGLPGVEYAPSSNAPCAQAGFNLVAGTTWLFANSVMKDAPVDFLIVDEAGQLALADAVAASRSAHNLILLGDPLQLSQVVQASHPGGGGNSALEHVLGTDVTIPSDRGVFLQETRRMHPDVCRFISAQIYEGRLHSHPSCYQQSTAAGTGLRWLRAEHSGRLTQSPEEAVLVAERLADLLGTRWVDQHGVSQDLTVNDVMVVAPYNDQVGLLRAHLDGDPKTRGVQVGTVDKFQGREAAVVFFTMTTSSPEVIPRGSEFLFSRNRLNVAISRARCIAYLVCTEALLNSKAKTIDHMRLISTLCSVVEYSAQETDENPLSLSF
jgi:predicted RecB family nuclease